MTDEKNESGGKLVSDLYSKFKNHQLTELELAEQLLKLYQHLEKPDWLSFIDDLEFSLYDTWMREEFKLLDEKELSRIVDLWEKFPKYLDFKREFENFQKTISWDFIFQQEFKISYYPYIWPKEYVPNRQEQVFARGIKTETGFCLVSIEADLSQSLHVLPFKRLEIAQKNRFGYQFVGQGSSVLCRRPAKWCAYSYSLDTLRVKALHYFVTSALYAYTLTFEADEETYNEQSVYFDIFLSKFEWMA